MAGDPFGGGAVEAGAGVLEDPGQLAAGAGAELEQEVELGAAVVDRDRLGGEAGERQRRQRPGVPGEHRLDQRRAAAALARDLRGDPVERHLGARQAGQEHAPDPRRQLAEA